MNYPIPNKIKLLCEKDNLKDPTEQEDVKKELVKFLSAYLSLDEGDDKGKNSLANVTDIVSKDGEFPVKGAFNNYPFQRDVAGRMMRTRNFTMQEGINEAGKKEVYVIAADRDWWDKYKLWALFITLILGTIIGAFGQPLSNLIDGIINKKEPKTEVLQLKVRLKSVPILHQTDSVYTLEIEKMDSATVDTTTAKTQ